MCFYLPQVQISCWKTTMPSVNSSQKCLGFFLIHGICSTTSFLIPWFENYCYGSSNTEAHGSTEQAFGAHHEDEALRERGSRTDKEVERRGIGPGRKDASSGDKEHWAPGTWQGRELLGKSTVMARGDLQVTLKLDEIQELHVLCLVED